MAQIDQGDYTDRASVKSIFSHRRNHAGQAIVEYLLVTAAVVGALFWVMGTVQWKTNNVISTALGQIP